jgi:hypothetical protein
MTKARVCVINGMIGVEYLQYGTDQYVGGNATWDIHYAEMLLEGLPAAIKLAKEQRIKIIEERIEATRLKRDGELLALEQELEGLKPKPLNFFGGIETT